MNASESSLSKRLAGPSTHKAGLDSVNQELVNKVRSRFDVQYILKRTKIIYEASRVYRFFTYFVRTNAAKGSKYFENERRKDEELTLKVNNMLTHLHKLERMDLTLDLKAADEKLAQLELHRDLSQCIVHVDCDAFYASVEELDQPHLKEVPMGVGLGVLTTTNYKARAFGVRSAMPVYIAKKICPSLTVVNLNFDKYIPKAEEIREVLAKYDPNYLAGSLDEAYLNLTPYIFAHDLSPEDVLTKLRCEVREKSGIIVSAGMAANTRLAKIASNQKKPNGQFILPNTRVAIMGFLSELPIRKINGIGKVTERELVALGVETVSDIYKRRHLLFKLFGQKTFEFLLEVSLGIGSTEVRPAEDYERKSISTESTFRDMANTTDIKAKLKSLCTDLEQDCIKANTMGRCVSIKYKLHTYEVFTRQRMVHRYVYEAADIYKMALPLLEKEFPMKIRLLGIRLSHLSTLNKQETETGSISPTNQVEFCRAGRQDCGSSSC